MRWLYIVAFFIALGSNIYALRTRKRNLVYITKPLLTILLMLFYVSEAGKNEAFVVLALVAGLAGDVFLMLPDRNYFFLSGLFSFLSGHIFYILAFVKLSNYLDGLGLWFYLLAIPYVVAGIVIFARLKPLAGKMTPSVAVYILTIISMGISSLTTLKSAVGFSFLFPVVGSLLFIVSDSCLAFAKFTRVKSRDGIVMTTYGLAQLFITLWFTLCK